MTKQYLDKTGLTYFWGKVKNYVDNSGGGGGGSSEVTLITEDTNAYTLASGLYKVQSTTGSGATGRLFVPLSNNFSLTGTNYRASDSVDNKYIRVTGEALVSIYVQSASNRSITVLPLKNKVITYTYTADIDPDTDEPTGTGTQTSVTTHMAFTARNTSSSYSCYSEIETYASISDINDNTVHHITADGRNNDMFTHAINVNDIAITREIYDGSTVTNVTFPVGTLFFFKYATTLPAPGLIITPTGDMYSVTDTATLVITATKIGTVGGGSGSDSQIEVIVDIQTTLPSDSTDYEEGQKICIVDSSSSTDVYKVYTATNGSWDSGVYLDRVKLYMLLLGNSTLSLEPGLYGVGYTVGVEHSEFLYYYAPTSTGIGQSTTNTFKDLESGTYLINASTFIYPTKIRTTTGVINQSNTLNVGSNYYYLSIHRADTSAYMPSNGDTFMIISPTCSVTGSVTGTSASGLYTTVTWDVKTSFVDLTSNQTIGGVKTFSSVPVCATQPTSNNELANKAYVDAQAGFDYTSITGYSQSTANQFLTHDTNGNLMWSTIPVAAQNTLGGVKAYVDVDGDLQISTQ